MAVQVNVSADQKKLIDSINKGVNAYNRRFASSNSIDLKINERSFTQPLGRISGAVDDFGAAMAASNARVIAFGASTAVLGSAVAGFRSLARASIEVEKNLADVNRILQLTTSDLQMFGKELFNISKRTATSFNDASKALLEFSRQGLDAGETLKRTNDALTLTRLAGLGAEASVAALTATVNGFSKSGLTTTQVLNKLVAVEQSFAVSARDLSQGLARTGQAAQEAGVDIDQLNALISAAQQRTARGGAVIGNALKTIFTRLQRSDTLDNLEKFNVLVRDVEGGTLPATVILQNFANTYEKLADAQRSQLSEQIAGVYQVNILKAIVSDLNSEQSVYNGALAKGSQATNEAARANAQLNQTLSALLVQTGNNAQQLASTIGSVTFEPLAKSAAKAANSILETFTGLLTGEGLASDFANGLLKGIRNVLGGPGAVAAFYTLFKLVQNSFVYVAQALPQLAGITTETQKRQSLEQAILGILQQENTISKALVGTTGNQKRQAEILLGVAKQQTAEYQKQKTIASGLAATLRTQGVSVGSRGLQTGKTRSGGFIPNSTKQAERSGALAGGYMPGKVINSPVGGVMNTAEQVKYVPGFAQPFINPPKTSRAGRLHRVESLRQTGVNPYVYDGFVPNFVKTDKIVNLNPKKKKKGFTGSLDDLRISPSEAGQIERVADYKTNGEITDSVKGLMYNIKEITNHTNRQYRSQAEKIIKGKNVADFLPASGRGRFNQKRWSENLEKSKNFKPSKENSKLLVDSLMSNKQVNFEKQKTGLVNNIAGELFESKIAGNKRYIRNSDPNARFDFAGNKEAKVGKFTLENLIAKAIGSKAKTYNNATQESIDFTGQPFTLLVPPKAKSQKSKRSSGFIPNFAAAYRNAYTGKLNNSAIARGLKSGDLSASEAAAMGYTTSGSKIDARKAKRASFVNSLNYKQVYVPWDIEAFRAKGSAAKGQTFNQTQGSTYEKYILNSLRSGIKGTTSLGAPFALPARPDAINGNLLKGKINSRIDGYSLSAGEMYEMKSGDKGDTLAGLQNKFIQGLKNNPEILNPKRKWKNYIFRTTKAKGRGASNGFIPNLAYKGEVMDLEESISGEKAIYSNAPFPHVRNASQSTFASAVADHGGLSNALKDSHRNQASAGLINGGFVPNFAAEYQTTEGAGVDVITGARRAINLTTDSQKKFNLELKSLIKLYKEGSLTRKELIASTEKLADENKLTLDSQKRLRRNINARARSEDKAANRLGISKAQRAKAEMQAAKEAKAQAKKDRTRQKVSNFGMSLAFAGPMIAGLAEQAYFGDTKRSDLSEGERMAKSGLSTGLTAATTGASMLAPFGPWGIAIGAAGGALLGLTSAFKAAELSVDEFSEKITARSEKQIGILTSFATANERLQSATAQGDRKAISKAQESLVSLVASTGRSDLAKKESGELNDIINEQRKNSSRALSLLSTIENIESSNSGQFGIVDSFEEKVGTSIGRLILKTIKGFDMATELIGKGIASIIDTTTAAFQTSMTILAGSVKDSFSKILEGIESLASTTMLGILRIIAKVPGAETLLGVTDDDLKITQEEEREKYKAAFSDFSIEATKSSKDFKKAFNEALTNLIPEGFKKSAEGLKDSIKEIFQFAGQTVITNDAGMKNFEMDRVVKAFSKLGGGGESILSIINQVRAGAKNANTKDLAEIDFNRLIAEIDQVALAGTERREGREDIDIKNVGDFLSKQGVDESLVQVFERLLKNFSEEGSDVGKFILSNFKDFVEKLEDVNDEAEKIVSQQVKAQENFTARIQLLKASIEATVARSELSAIGTKGARERASALSTRDIGLTKSFGKPFEAARLAFNEQKLRINQGLQDSEISQKNNLSKTIFSTVSDKEAIGLGSDVFERLSVIDDEFNKTNASIEDRIAILKKLGEDESSMGFLTDTARNDFLRTLRDASIERQKQLATQEESVKTAQALYDIEKQSLEQSRSMSFQFEKSVSSMSDDADLALGRLAFEAPRKFADGMANALSQVADGTKDIGDAFSDMAIDFGKMLQQEVFRALAQKAVGNLLSGFTTGQTGGSMSQGAIKAQNGMYISGGRTGDRNLALLEDGEYVLNRNAVRGMGGRKALDKLNFGMAPRFQSGGYNMYADQTLKNGEYDFTGDLTFNGSNAGDVNPDLYSAYAFENSPYFQRQKEIANEKLQRKIRKRFEKMTKRAQLTGAIINMVGSFAAASAGNSISASQNAGAAAKSAGSALQSTAEGGNAALAAAAQKSDYSFGRYIQRNSSTLTLNGQTLNQLGTNKVMANLATNPNFINEADFAKQYSSDSFQRQMADPFGGGMFNRDRVKISSVFNDAGFTAQASNKPGLLKAMFSGARGFFGKGKRQEGGLINYNSGGFVPHGSRLSDTIPAMLTGGEYVMNNKAVAKYGLGTMNAMNAGGLSTSSTTNNSTNNNATSISVSVDRSGKSEYGAQTTSYNKDDIVISKEMAQQINALVLKRVVDEKRYGGELYKNPLRT